jgi:hypothetical protein
MSINPEGQLITSQLLNVNIDDIRIRIRLGVSNEDNIRDIAESMQDIG